MNNNFDLENIPHMFTMKEQNQYVYPCVSIEARNTLMMMLTDCKNIKLYKSNENSLIETDSYFKGLVTTFAESSDNEFQVISGWKDALRYILESDIIILENSITGNRWKIDLSYSFLDLEK